MFITKELVSCVEWNQVSGEVRTVTDDQMKRVYTYIHSPEVYYFY